MRKERKRKEKKLLMMKKQLKSQEWMKTKEKWWSEDTKITIDQRHESYIYKRWVMSVRKPNLLKIMLSA